MNLNVQKQVKISWFFTKTAITTSFKLDANDIVLNLLKRTPTALDCYDNIDHTYNREHSNTMWLILHLYKEHDAE